VTARIAVATAYAVLGATLLWSRLWGLDRGYCCDEIRTVTDYVERGPRAILGGAFVPNDHQLFSMAGWATDALIGESPLALRLWSVLPFLLGVAVVTAWLHRRIGALSALLYLFLVTASPLLLDITRMARGYGIAFLAMSVLLIGALETERSGRSAPLALACVGGTAGSLTLPHFTIAFVATLAVLLMRPDLRSRVLVGLASSLVLVFAWYVPHTNDIAGSALADYGHRIHVQWLGTAPIDQTLVPALTQLDDDYVAPSLWSLLWSCALAALLATSPLIRQPRTAFLLCSGVVTTVLAFWITGTYVVPRFFSFLLVPLFMLLATGSAAVFGRLRTNPAPARTVAAVATLGLLGIISVPLLLDVPRMPRDAGSEAARTIDQLVPRSTPVFAHVAYSRDLAFHLGRAVKPASTPSEARAVCRSDRRAVYVDQPYLVPAAAVPCTLREGTIHRSFAQYARGQRIDVWIIPAAKT
jgi:hypothetical protein